MKTIIALLITVVGVSAFAAKALDKPTKAKRAKKSLEAIVFQIEGVNGIGVTGCDPKTGKKSDFSADFVHCVEVMTETDAAKEQVLAIYPEGTKIKGAFVIVNKVGEIVPHPRASGGN